MIAQGFRIFKIFDFEFDLHKDLIDSFNYFDFEIKLDLHMDWEASIN